MRCLVFDNYDSFTYNLVHLVEQITGQRPDVCLNDSIGLDDVDKYDRIILSPGPGLPEDAGLLLHLIERYAPVKTILGVCLGHQAIGKVFGGNLVNLPMVYHGVSTPVHQVRGLAQRENDVLKVMPDPFFVGRYHSWIISNDGFPEDLEVVARDEAGHIMAIRHRQWDVQGVQFHPESVLTPDGEKMMRNWLGNDRSFRH